MKDDIIALVAQLNREIDFLTKELLEATNLTKMEAVYLLHISRNQGVNQYRIAKYYNSSRKLVGVHINSLEKKGYIYKVAKGRCKNLYLSEIGRERVEEIVHKKEKFNAFIPINDKEVAKLKSDLSKLITIFQNINNRDNLYRID